MNYIIKKLKKDTEIISTHNCIIIVMVPRERIKCSKLMPPSTEFNSCVSVKTTYIGSNHWYTKQ